MRISNYKVDQIASNPVQSKVKKRDKTTKELSAKVRGLLLEGVPDEVLHLQQKYPSVINGRTRIILGPNYETVYFDEVPYIEGLFKEHSTGKKGRIYEKVKSLLEKRNKEFKEIQTLGNKIKCTISKLRTYAALKKEFPEAYQVLISKVDGNKKGGDSNLCDDVESLRAELSSTK